MSAPITIYLAGWCPYCQRAKQLLTSKNLAFTEIDVESGPGLREDMVRKSGRRTVPQIFIGEQHVGGCDDLFALDASGELDRLTQGA
jgi:glutaredoxin 3